MNERTRPFEKPPVGSFGWLRYGEVILNKAEAQACLGDAGAAETLRTLLITRYKVLPVIPSGGEQLVKMIRQERRKELCFEGHRWFDLRRYAVNTAYPESKSITHQCHVTTVTHGRVHKHVGEVTLHGYDQANRGYWMLPIPRNVIDFCEGTLDNLPRETGVTRNLSQEYDDET